MSECSVCNRDCPPPLVESSTGMTKNPEGFSRRHWTSKPLEASQVDKEGRLAEFYATMADNETDRAKRSPQAQLAKLDRVLGKDKGAKKERARLALMVDGKSKNKKK